MAAMAGRGPAPKPDDQRRRRNAQPDKTILSPEPFQGPSPDLPRGRWLKRTRDWYEVWRHAPQAAMFGPTEWEFLATTAYVADKLFRGEVSAAAELRLREAKLGATPEDRLRLRIGFDKPEVGGAEQPTREDRRQRLRALADGS